jgi:hypothetical protein
VVYLSGVQCTAWKRRWMKPVVPVVIKHWIVSNFFFPSLQKKCSNWLHCFHPSLFGFPIATRCVTPQLLPQCATATRQSPWSTLIPHTRWDNCWQRRFWIFPKMDRILLAMVKNGWPQTWILYYHKNPNHGCCARKALTLELMLPWNLAGSTARNIKQVCYQT